MSGAKLKAHCLQNISIIDAMTSEERAKPECIGELQVSRIAGVAGVSHAHVNNLLAAFESTRLTYLQANKSRDNATGNSTS